MCDCLVVVWQDGVGFAKNSDRDPNEAQRLDWHPGASHAVGSTLRCTWITIPQVSVTRAVLLSRPFWMWGAEMGTNDAGVVIGNEAVFTRRPMESTGLTGMDLVRLGLERSDSASQAAEVISRLIREHGQGGRAGYSNPNFTYHNSFLIADHRGAIVLESAGREVALERVTQGVRAISNGLTIPSMLRHSDRLRSRVAQCQVRRGRVESLGRLASCPLGLAHTLRDHGGAFCSWERRTSAVQPQYNRWNGALSAACVHFGGLVAGSQTVASWVSHLTSQDAKHWATGTSAPCISLFRPVSIEQPRETGFPSGQPDSDSLWWRFENLHRRLIRDWDAANEMKSERDKLEQAIFRDFEKAEKHWNCADDWLSKWEQSITAPEERRPRWLQKRWAQVVAEAEAGNRLPPR